MERKRQNRRRPKNKKSKKHFLSLGNPGRQASTAKLLSFARIKIRGPGQALPQKTSLREIPPFPGAVATIQQNVGAQTFITHTGATGDAIVATPTAELAYAFAFALQDLPQVATWQAAFDQYRIERIDLRLFYRGNVPTNQNAASPNALIPMNHVVVDLDDDTALAAHANAMEYDSHRYLRAGDSYELSFIPAVAPAIFGGGAFSGYAVVPSNCQWLDIASSSEKHYGLKGVIEPLTVASTENIIWDVNATYTVSFAGVR